MLMHFTLKQAYKHSKYDMTLQLPFALKNTIDTPQMIPSIRLHIKHCHLLVLQCSSWQYQSNQIWCSIGFYPMRNDEHAPCPASLTSLSLQKHISFLPDIPPWDLQPQTLTIVPYIPNLHKCNPPSLCQPLINHDHSFRLTTL